MKTADKISLPQSLEDTVAHPCHLPHADNHVGRVSELDPNLADVGAQRSHAVGDEVHGTSWEGNENLYGGVRKQPNQDWRGFVRHTFHAAGIVFVQLSVHLIRLHPVTQLGLDPLAGRRFSSVPRRGADKRPLLHSCYVSLLGTAEKAGKRHDTRSPRLCIYFSLLHNIRKGYTAGAWWSLNLEVLE